MSLSDIHLAVALLLLETMSIGPTPSDRLMAAQLLGTSGVGLLLLITLMVIRP